MASKRFVQHFSASCAHELSEAINRWLAEHPDVDIVSLSSYKTTRALLRTPSWNVESPSKRENKYNTGGGGVCRRNSFSQIPIVT